MSKMKKIILSIVAMLSLCAGNTYAQQPDAGVFSLKPFLGVSLSYMAPRPSYVNDLKPGLTAGVEGSYQVNDNLALSLGLSYTNMGVKEKNMTLPFEYEGVKAVVQAKDLRQDIHYVQVPLLCSYYVADGLALKAGVQVGFSAAARYKFNLIEGVPGAKAYFESEDTKLDDVNTFDFGIPVGVSYEIDNVCLDLRYYFGLNRVFKDTEATRYYEMSNAKNRGLTFTVGYKFNFGE